MNEQDNDSPDAKRRFYPPKPWRYRYRMECSPPLYRSRDAGWEMAEWTVMSEDEMLELVNRDVATAKRDGRSFTMNLYFVGEKDQPAENDRPVMTIFVYGKD